MTNVLVVIPEEIERDRLARELAGADFRVYACGRFEEARDAIDRLQPDVLVTNLRLNEYNGLSLVMRANERCPEAKKVICTPFDDPVHRREAVMYGAAFLHAEQPSHYALISAFAD